jgi:hypothetical protein
MKVKWCYKCDTEKLLRDFYGPAEHKNALCSDCYDASTRQGYKDLGFSELED